jgi:CO dehydrogenase/acetyl-CoA synthase delta subunit
MSPGPRRIAAPLPAVVQADAGGVPLQVDGRTVDAIRESWLVEDRWWTDRPLRRRYWEVVTTCGRNVVLFRDLAAGERGWYRQR